MRLRDFILNFVRPNTLIRLWYPNPYDSGHTMAGIMDIEHQIIKDLNYSELEVIGVTDILVDDNYPEAVNIVVKRMTLDKVREIKINSLISERV